MLLNTEMKIKRKLTKNNKKIIDIHLFILYILTYTHKHMNTDTDKER